MRIGIDVHCIGGRQTGNETYFSNLIDGYARSGRVHQYFLYHTVSGRAADRFGNCPLVREGSLQFRTVWPKPAILRIPLGFPVSLARDRIDVAHFNYVSPPVSSCATVVTVHDVSYELFPEYFHPLQRKRLQWLVPRSARAARQVLTVSEFSRRELIERYRLPEEKVTATPLAAATEFRRLAEPEARRRIQRLDVKTPYLLAVSNLQPRKNLLRLVRAYAALVAKGRCDHDLILVGQSAWKGQHIAEEVKRLRLQDRVKLTGYVSNEELCALYSLATAFAYPSTYEGFGLPILEAMSVGTPVITSRAASMPEVAGDAAILVDPYSESEIESALDSVVNDAALRCQLKQLGLSRSACFSWDRASQQTLDVYEKAA